MIQLGIRSRTKKSDSATPWFARGARGQAHFFPEASVLSSATVHVRFLRRPNPASLHLLPPRGRSEPVLSRDRRCGNQGRPSRLNGVHGHRRLYLELRWRHGEGEGKLCDVFHVAAILTCWFCSWRSKSRNSKSFRCTLFWQTKQFQAIMAAFLWPIYLGGQGFPGRRRKALRLEKQVSCRWALKLPSTTRGVARVWQVYKQLSTVGNIPDEPTFPIRASGAYGPRSKPSLGQRPNCPIPHLCARPIGW